LWCEREH